ncbi:MAG TPA: PP2C family serine/threonine-protein phosphatase [Cerasibacillus sp.]|uniref:PP2C family protein-serine/threonine phosphatase n=1 Tax=Cerasibacillus sp. TaxID=2498711 RepID=UPI002F40BAE5
MTYLAAYHTDVGLRKNINQDALLIKTAQTPVEEIGLFVVCDGMGGLSHGELASATVIYGLSQWFEHDLPELLEYEKDNEEIIFQQLENTVEKLNADIVSYGQEEGVVLGTTLTALLILGKTFFLVQMGDSRAYAIDDNQVIQLTKDQTFVAREVARGHLTPEEARNHPKRNILLQCIGAREEIEVVITKGIIEQGMSYLLCTDGFYHKLSHDELIGYLQTEATETDMKQAIQTLSEIVKSRHETDNISAVLLKVV